MSPYFIIFVLIVALIAQFFRYKRNCKELNSRYEEAQKRKSEILHENFTLTKKLEAVEKECKTARSLAQYYEQRYNQQQNEKLAWRHEQYEAIRKENEQKLKEEYAMKSEKLRELIDSSNITSFSASMYADVVTYVCKLEIEWLENKFQPAYSTASKIEKKVNEKCKLYLQQYREMLYKYEYLLKSFPELESYVDNIDSLKEITYDNLQQFGEEYDRTRNYLTKDEYEKLSSSVRNQIALDRYVNSHNKTDWEIGRDYELFCGYKLRSTKSIISVQQHGIEKGLEDLGIDIIAKDISHIYIIQCKYWSQYKEIHEKHIAQLYGSAKEYEIKNKISSNILVVPVFITTTELSDMAKTFAKHLGVRLVKWKFEEFGFPRIKCNISKDGEKIYHLPFDQQYDSTKIEGNGDFYAKTVEEAEKKGFRRAYRWNGN